MRKAIVSFNTATRFADKLASTIGPEFTFQPALCDPIANTHAAMRKAGYSLAAIIRYTTNDTDIFGFHYINYIALRYTFDCHNDITITFGDIADNLSGISCQQLNRDRGI